MTKEEIQFLLFHAKCMEIAGAVQVSCTLASQLSHPQSGFDLLHTVLNGCLNEMCNIEARVIKDESEGWIDLEKKDPEDGN